jgi:phage gp36-like protein
MLDRVRNREDVRTRYEDAIEWLKSVAAGKVSLGLDTVVGVPVVETETVGFVSYGVSRSIDMEGF